MSSSLPRVPNELQSGEPFFDSKKRKWVDNSLTAPPMGVWQQAPPISSSGFSQGGSLFGEAVYSDTDRNLTSTSAPVVSGVMCVAKDKASTTLQESDIVIISNTSYNKRVHTIQKATPQMLHGGSKIAVVAAYHSLDVRFAGASSSGSSVSLICCGQIRLRVKDVERLVPTFNLGSGKLPGDTFSIGNKHFIILTPVNQLTHEMRCMMDNIEN